MLLGAEKWLPAIGEVDNEIRKFLGSKIILQWLIGAICADGLEMLKVKGCS